MRNCAWRLVGALLVAQLMLVQLWAYTVQVDDRELWIEPPPPEMMVRGAVLWLPVSGRDVPTEQDEFQAEDLQAAGIAVVYCESHALGWRARVDRAKVLAFHRWLRERYQLEPQQIIVGGQGDGAALAHEMVVSQPYWFGGAVLALGAYGGHWERADEHRPVFGVYATTRSKRVPLKTLRAVEKRLSATGYPTLWRSQMVTEEIGEDYGADLFALIFDVCAAAGLTVADVIQEPRSQP